MRSNQVGLSRRQILAQTALAAAGASLAPCLAHGIPATKPLFGISLAEWSLHRALRGGSLDHLDFPKTARQDYNIATVELVNQFFKDKATDKRYLAEFKKRADDHGVRILLIMCDEEGALGDADESKRAKAIQNHHKWLEAASFFGCHSIRVNPDSTGAAGEQRDRLADGLRRLAEFAATLNLNVLVENHGKPGELACNGAWLVSVIKQVNLPNCGTLPDFGNFYDYDRYQGVAEMMPFAKAVSAKTMHLDASGNESQIDYPRMLKIVLDAGYRGHLGIEYEGEDHPESEGIRLTNKLLEELRDELSPKYRP